MARLIPSNSLHLARQGAHPAEADTLAELAKALPHGYSIFHSIHWTNAHATRTVFGEIDFVVVNHSGEVLVIEQKNGDLVETDDGLVKLYGDAPKNLHSQIDRGIAGIREKYGNQHHGSGMLINYLIYCPDHTMRNINAAALDATRIVDSRAKNSLAARIQELLGEGPKEPSATCITVLGFFCQSYDLVPDVSAYVQAGEQAYTRLSGGLLDTIRNIEFAPFRLRVEGVAGCGKTQLALSYMSDAHAGRNTLYVCYNRPLCDQMSSLTQRNDSLSVETFHGICTKTVEATGEVIDFSGSENNPRFWPDLVERVIALDIPEERKFDRIIVDEGQDFEQEWWDVLQLFLRDNYELLWLEDAHQNVRGIEQVRPPTPVTYRANTSYRSPQSIASFIAKALAPDFRSGLPLPGLGVGVYSYENQDDVLKLLRARVNDLRKTGFRNDEIAVLTCTGLDKSVLAGQEELAGIKLRRFMHSYESDHQAIYSAGALLFESVRRFKGGQAPAVILIDVDSTNRDPKRWRSVMFCGATRATTRLELLVSSNDKDLEIYRSAVL